MKHPAFLLVPWLAVFLSHRDLHAQGGLVQTRIMNAYRGLIFDQPGQPIVSGNQQSYNIQILDPRTLVLEIAAPPRTPLMVQIQSVQQIWNHAVSPAESIPFAWEAAFCNAGINDERMARRLALPLDVNQNQFQFDCPLRCNKKEEFYILKRWLLWLLFGLRRGYNRMEKHLN